MNEKNSYIPLSVPDIRGNPISKISKAIKENWISSASPGVEEFENKIAKICNSNHALATITGSAALHLALVSLGLGKNSKVVVPDLTFAATINSVILSGALPILVDVNDYSWTLDVELFKKSIKLFKPDAVIVVHTLGHPAEMDEIKELCISNKILLIEDAAGSMGSTYKGEFVGSLGDAGIFSFNGNKIFTTGSGGAVILNNDQFADAARLLYKQARYNNSYSYKRVGYNYRMSNLNASLGLSQINFLHSFIAKKRKIAFTYDNAFKNIVNLKPMPRLEWSESNCWLYTLQTKNKIHSISLIEYLKEKGIDAKLFWNALSSELPYSRYDKVLTGNSINLTGKLVSLPCSTSLTFKDQLRVFNAVNQWNFDNI